MAKASYHAPNQIWEFFQTIIEVEAHKGFVNKCIAWFISLLRFACMFVCFSFFCCWPSYLSGILNCWTTLIHLEPSSIWKVVFKIAKRYIITAGLKPLPYPPPQVWYSVAKSERSKRGVAESVSWALSVKGSKEQKKKTNKRRWQ